MRRERQGRGSPDGSGSPSTGMKCGVGLCGFCAIDPGGIRVCKEGPVIRGDRLIGTEFGSYTRDASGRRRPVP